MDLWLQGLGRGRRGSVRGFLNRGDNGCLVRERGVGFEVPTSPGSLELPSGACAYGRPWRRLPR